MLLFFYLLQIDELISITFTLWFPECRNELKFQVLSLVQMQIDVLMIAINWLLTVKLLIITNDC